MNEFSLLQCYKLNKNYKEGEIVTNVLHGVDFTLQYGEMVGIIGNSGSGKSTLLNLLGGLDSPSSGEIIFEGQRLSSLSSNELSIFRNQKLGFIYQFHHLLLDFTALENVAMPLLIGGVQSFKAQNIAWKMLSAVGLNNRAYYRPAKLSGGERQRVAIARALVNYPSLVLADEPTGNLDQNNAESIFRLLRDLNTHNGISFLIVTHDVQLAKKLHRQFEMRDGILIEIEQ